MTRSRNKKLSSSAVAKKLYHYRARMVKVYDGDTCTLAVDLGFDVWIQRMQVRLNRIDAPEIKGATRTDGIAARDFLKGLLLGKELIVQTLGDEKEKYGRYLAEIFVDGFNVNDEMINTGHAEVYSEKT